MLEADDLSKGFGDKLLVEDLSFSFRAGGIVGVIGPNGAGKTTLFRMLAGQSAGLPAHATWRKRRTCLRRSSARQLSDDKTVWEEISDGQD